MTDHLAPDRAERVYEHACLIREVYLRDRAGRPHSRRDWQDFLDALLGFLKEPPDAASPPPNSSLAAPARGRLAQSPRAAPPKRKRSDD